MKKSLLILAFAAAFSAANAQTDQVAKEVAGLAKNSKNSLEADSAKPWKFSGMLSLTASHTGLKHWSAGGDQSIGFNALANFNANCAKNRHSWQNSVIAQYGTVKLYDLYDEFRKTDDKMQFSSKYGYAFSKKFYYSAIFDYKSQLASGYTYTKNDAGEEEPHLSSHWWSPLYLTYAVGVDCQPDEHLSFYFSPLCGKTTIVSNDDVLDYFKEKGSDNAYGVKIGDHSRSEFGWYFKANALYTIGKNVTFNSNLTLFQNYEDGYPFKEVDVDWNVIITLQFNKWLAFNITTELIYDEDIEILIPSPKKNHRETPYNSKVQFKDIIGAGLTFKF